jgi:hypothetical protein
VLERSLEISLRNSFDAMTFALRASGVDVLAIFPELPGGTMLDFDEAPAFIEAGRAAAQKALAAWGNDEQAIMAMSEPGEAGEAGGSRERENSASA